MYKVLIIVLLSLGLLSCKESKSSLDQDFDQAVRELQCLLIALDLAVDWRVQNETCILETNLKTPSGDSYSVQFSDSELDAITRYRNVEYDIDYLRRRKNK